MKSPVTQKYYNSLLSAIEFIEAHLQEEIKLEDISRITGISHWHFQKIFHQSVGETLGSYLRRRRLAISLELLRTTPLKIIDIAFSFHFESSEAYSRAFKAEYGISPLEFRKTQIKVVTRKKPALTRQSLDYLLTDITINPTILDVPQQLFVGISTNVISPLAKRAQYLKQVDHVWQEYFKWESRIPNRIDGYKVGVIQDMAHSCYLIHDEKINYSAGCFVTSFTDLPDQLTQITLPAGAFGVFQSVGYHNPSQFLIDYVYSAWLPNNDYVRRDGLEFMVIDHREKPLDPKTSVIDYYIPMDLSENRS